MFGAIPPITQYAFMVWCSVKEKHMDNVTFTFYLYVLKYPEPSTL